MTYFSAGALIRYSAVSQQTDSKYLVIDDHVAPAGAFAGAKVLSPGRWIVCCVPHGDEFRVTGFKEAQSLGAHLSGMCGGC